MVDSLPIVLYFVFLFVGNLLLLVLLLTFAFSRSLPQRRNFLLLNLLLTTYLSTFPPMMLLVTGNLRGKLPPKTLCIAQAILMDGIAPMFGMSSFVLAFWTWSEIRAAINGTISLGNRYRWLKPTLLALPYFVFLSWSGTSLVASLTLGATPELKELVSCSNVGNIVSNRIRFSVGYFVGINYLTAICFEVGMVYLVKVQLSKRKKMLDTATAQVPYLNYYLVLRLLALTTTQLTAALIAILLSVSGLTGKSPLFFVLESLNPLSTFLAFGTTKDIFMSWTRRKDFSSETMGDNLSAAV